MTVPVFGTERPPLYSTAGHDLPLITRWVESIMERHNGERPWWLDQLDLAAMQSAAEAWDRYEQRPLKVVTDQERHERDLDCANAAAPLAYATGRYGQTGGV